MSGTTSPTTSVTDARWSYQVDIAPDSPAGKSGLTATEVRRFLHRNSQPSLNLLASVDAVETNNMLAIYQQNKPWAAIMNDTAAAYAKSLLFRHQYVTDGITVTATLVTETDHNIS